MRVRVRVRVRVSVRISAQAGDVGVGGVTTQRQVGDLAHLIGWG